MTGAIQQIVRGTDAAVARIYLSLFRERDALMPFLFHSLFRDEREINQNVVDPLQRTTVAQFRQFIEYYLSQGYRFISPADLLSGLTPGGKYALITFDDGYFSNSLALPILKEFDVPAAFFISANHIRQNKSFWWDVLYRELSAQNMAPRQIWREGVALKTLRNDQIEEELTRKFGPNAFVPRGDVDRPFTPVELKEFAADPHVHIGNHTANHAILTNYAAEEVRKELAEAQEALREITGVAPIAIAYPNGAYDDGIIDICNQVGLKIGFTVRPEKRGLPLEAESGSMFRLGRFMPHGEASMLSQCRTFRSDILLYGMFRDGYLRLHRGKITQ